MRGMKLFTSAMLTLFVVVAAAMPAVADTVTLQMVVKDLNPSDTDSMLFIEALEKGLAAYGMDVKFDVVEMPPGNYAEKLGLMIMSGSIPDIIYFQGGDKKIAEQGILEDLRPYAEKSEVVQKALWEHNKIRLQNYPYLIRAYPIRTRVLVIREDWLQKSGVTQPETVDDYYKLMKAIAEADFDGNGQNDTYGITATGNLVRLDAVYNQAFGISQTWLKAEDGKYVYYKVSQAEKDKLAHYAKLFQEKILDQEYVTTKWDTMEDKFYNGRVAIVAGTSGKTIDIYETKMQVKHPDAKLVALAPPKGVGQGFSAVDVSKEPRGFSISALSKNKEAAFKVLEYMMTPEGQVLDQLGLEGVHYTKEGGKIVPTPKVAQWFERFAIVTPEAWTPPEGVLGQAALDSMDLAAKFFVEDNKFNLPEEYIANWDAMENLYKEYSYKIITGASPSDAFDEFVEKWYELGGSQITEYANETLK